MHLTILKKTSLRFTGKTMKLKLTTYKNGRSAYEEEWRRGDGRR